MANPVSRGLRNLSRFSGRDTRAQFWPYAAVAFVASMAIGGAGMAWAAQGIFQDMASFAAEHPEAATVRSSPGSYSIAIDPSHPNAPTPDLSGIVAALAIMVILAVILLAAAVSRRLHDCNRTAYFAFAPVFFLAIGLTLFPVMMNDMTASAEPNLGLFFALFFNNLIYIGTLSALIVQCAMRGTSGPNRFGPQPIAVD